MKNIFDAIAYRSYDMSIMRQQLNIDNYSAILDVGGGNRPISNKAVVVDFDLFDGIHRDGGVIDFNSIKYLSADVHYLPFRDKYFDFVFCSHVLEHVIDPILSCSEICRVGVKGYIETPSKCAEIFAGHPSHQWLVSRDGGTLFFERKPFIQPPYFNSVLVDIWNNSFIMKNALEKYCNISYLQFLWEDGFDVKVIECSNGFHYENPLHAAYSHYFFARNSFILNAPLTQGIYHIQKANLLMNQNNDNFKLLLICYNYLLRGESPKGNDASFIIDRLKLSFKDTLKLRLLGLKSIVKKVQEYFIERIEEDEPVRLS